MTIEAITSDLIPATHGFFTRRGGASSGVFKGLNCGRGSSDQCEAVSLNRARVARHLGLEPDALIGAHQTHSATAITVTGPGDDAQEGDALVTATPGLALCILTADCQPVLFHDPKAGVIGAAHAGWRGAQTGVLEATLDAMEALGATRANTQAVIGPCISQRAYEVGPEFFDSFIADDPNAERFFAQGTGDRMLFDLPSYGLYRLRGAGVGTAQWTRHCTYDDETRFFSYRRATHRHEADYGRLLSAIVLP